MSAFTPVGERDAATPGDPGASPYDGARPNPAPPSSWVPRLCLVAADLVSVCLALWVAFALRQRLPGYDVEGAEPFAAIVTFLAPAIWIAVLAYYRLYTARHVKRPMQEFTRIFHAAAVSVGATALIAFMLRRYVSRGWLLLTFAAGVVTLTLERAIARRWFDHLRKAGSLRRPVLIVGINDEAKAIASCLCSRPELGYRVVGFLDDTEPPGSALMDIPVVGGAQDAIAALSRTAATGVVVVASAFDSSTINSLVRQLTDAGIHIEMLSSLWNIAPERLTVASLGEFPVVYVEPVPRLGWRMAAKRAFDIIVSSVGLIVLFPLVLLAALAIKLDSRGPVLFRQERMGKDGRPFRMLKLRSMVRNAHELRTGLLNEADGPLFKINNDPRVTRVGRILRATSLDEVPQLWNVLAGEMSLVGPRPALADEVAGWTPALHQRLRVRPGMTGMWQVNGRSNCRFDDYARLDLYYVDNWSLLMDVAILAKTIPTVLLRRGAR